MWLNCNENKPSIAKRKQKPAEEKRTGQSVEPNTRQQYEQFKNEPVQVFRDNFICDKCMRYTDKCASERHFKYKCPSAETQTRSAQHKKRQSAIRSAKEERWYFWDKFWRIATGRGHWNWLYVFWSIAGNWAGHQKVATTGRSFRTVYD